jgi:NitT/TauT family transport system substrate-binding protein
MFIQRKISRFLFLSVLSLTLLFFQAQDGESQSGSSQSLVIGYSFISANLTSLWVAKEHGLFKRYGVDPRLILITGGIRGAQALLAGDLAMIYIGPPPIIQARAKGMDVVLLAGLSNQMTYVIVGSPKVKRPDDLKGKRIAISGPGTSSHHVVLLALKQWGLEPLRDGITLLSTGDQGSRLAALESGAADAIIVNPGFAPTVMAKGYNVLADLSQLGLPYPLGALATTTRFIRANTQTVEGVLKGLVAGTAFILNPINKERTKAVLVKYLRLSGTEQAEEHYRFALHITEKRPYVNPAGIASIIEFMGERDPEVARLSPENIINSDFVKKLDAEGFIERLYRK